MVNLHYFANKKQAIKFWFGVLVLYKPNINKKKPV